MLKYSFLEAELFPRCQRCGGQVIRSYDELDCLQCSAPHTEEGKLARYPAQELGFSLLRRGRRGRRSAYSITR